MIPKVTTRSSAIGYAPPWNETIRLSLIGTIYRGRNKFKSFGFFDEKIRLSQDALLNFDPRWRRQG
jgi:hypothetical protein